MSKFSKKKTYYVIFENKSKIIEYLATDINTGDCQQMKLILLEPV
jgi:hypothetical protein